MFFARGVLIDVAAYKGVEMLPDTYEITVEDLEGALKKQGTTLQAGDAVLVNTGWHRLWAKDNARYVKSCPGHRRQGGAVADRQGPAAARLRQLAGEVAPNPDPQISLPVHQLALVVNGVHLLGEPQARRAGAEAGLRVRLRDAADQAAGRHRLDGRPGGRALDSRGRPPPRRAFGRDGEGAHQEASRTKQWLRSTSASCSSPT